jgi:hypothetical protein
MSIIDYIKRAKEKLEENNVKPTYVRLSPASHQWLVDEINKTNGTKHTAVFEILGLTVQVDNECPSGGAYVEGKEKG